MTRHYLDRLAEVIRTNWNQPALTDYATLDGGEGNSYTYGEMYGQIRALCDLFHQLSIQKGDHIALCGANSANWVVAYLAIAAYQGVCVTILHSQTLEEITRQINFADATTVFIDADLWQTIDISQLPQVQHVLSLRDFTSLISTTIPSLYIHNLQPSDVSFDLQPLDTLAQICFTSGSTEQAKAVMLSYRNLSNNVYNAVSTLPSAHAQSFVAILPFSHTYGLLGGLLCHLPNAHHIYMLGNLFSPRVLVEAIDKLHPYVIVIVPQIIEYLFNVYGNKLNSILGSSLQQLLVGGSHLDSEIEKSLLALHIPLTVGYGLTEAAPLLGASLWQDYVPYSGGHIVFGMQATISPTGEILVRGENVMLGYYKDPEATAAKIDKDGWLHTGDRGHIDEDGYLYVEGRLEQDMVVLPSGENISLPNVESIINQIDGVEESLVLVHNGHLVALVYASQNLNRQDLLRIINPQLPSFSQLYDIHFVSTPFQRTEKQTIKRYLYKF